VTFTSPEQQESDTEPRPRAGWLDPEGRHSVENVDTEPYEALRIEFKQA